MVLLCGLLASNILGAYSHAEIPVIRGTGTPGRVFITDSGTVAGFWFLNGGLESDTSLAKPFVWHAGRFHQLPLQAAEYGHVYGGDERSLVGDVDVKSTLLPARWTPDPAKGWAQAKLQILSKDAGWAVCKGKNGDIFIDSENEIRIWRNGRIINATVPRFDLVGVDDKGIWYGNRYQGRGTGNKHLGKWPETFDGQAWKRYAPKERRGESSFVAVNKKGEAAGNIFDSYDWIIAKWSATGSTTVERSYGQGFCTATDMNDFGDVVGATTDKSGKRAMVWRGEKREDLSAAIKDVRLSEAKAINNKGQIVASSDSNRLFVLTPKP